MTSTDSEGLGLSVTIYVAALMGGLALFVAPIYYANSPTVIENISVPQAGSPLAKPLYADHRGDPFPLARLTQTNLVDAQSLAALNAYAKAPQPRRAATHTREEASAAERPSERRQSRGFFPFFNLF